MATYVHTPVDGQAVSGAGLKSNFDELFTNITNDNISASAAISLSKLESGGSFTAWSTWTPTFTASGSMTFAATASVARYTRIGKIVYFQITASGTTGGTASTAVRFTLPVTPALSATANSIGGGCWVTDTNTASGYWGWNTAGYIQVFKYDLSNFGLGASRAFSLCGFYEVA